MEGDLTRVILWSIPRSSSTAFLKCLTYVPDTQVWFEPYLSNYYFYKFGNIRQSYVKVTNELWGANIRDMDEDFTQGIAGGYLAMDKSPFWMKQQLEGRPVGKKVIFSKDMAWGLEKQYQDRLPQGFQHTFLIRHPYQVFDSWKRMVNRGVHDKNKTVLLKDVPNIFLPDGYSYEEQYDLYLYVKQNINPNPVIIDNNDLLANPGRVLKAYCEAVGIPYSDDLLQWKPGRECLDEKWMVPKEHIFAHNLGGIHTETFKSTGFGNARPCPDRSELDDDVLHCSDACLKYYDEMYAKRLKL
ncbi:uncharacterized protein [Amphiura filiformis]|uniref:uncharacterized protein n=1 Tax=Amphiura filiformis TaxID=82378 RepID=UPI003B219CFA